MNRYLTSLAIIILCLTTVSCRHEKKMDDPHVVSVYPRSNTTHLFYSGNIKPLREDLIISPANGVVNKMNFHYGDFVKKGDVLFTLHSPDMENEFRDCITNYLRAKQAYLTSKKSMIGTQALYKEKIISEQEYENEKGQYQNNTLSYIAGSTKLKQFINYLPGYQEKLVESDSIDLKEAIKILQENMDDLTITAPTSGIILFPEEKNSESASKEIKMGLEVKKHEVLLEVGNLSGLSVTANVTENDINNVKIGRQVILSLQSDLETELRGVIVSVAKQAKNVENVGFSTFPVVIQVPTLSKDAMEKIRVGMNTKLDILIEEPPSIKIPITAVLEKNHKHYVTMMDAQGNKHESEVTTGLTTQNEVTILKGLKKGDRIVIDD